MIRSNQSHEQGILTRYWAIPLDQSALSTTRHYRHTPGFQLITLNCGSTLLEGEYHVYRHQSNPIVAPAHLEITTFAEASLPGLPEHHGTLETRSPAPRHTHASGGRASVRTHQNLRAHEALAGLSVPLCSSNQRQPEQQATLDDRLTERGTAQFPLLLVAPAEIGDRPSR